MRSLFTSLPAIFLLSILALHTALAAESLTGTYTIQGNQGAIVLTLRQNKDGGVEGTLKGGTLSLVLKGFPREDGGVLGTARTADGQMASYFQVEREGGQILFDFIEVGPGGDPDMTKKNRVTFPAGNNGGGNNGGGNNGGVKDGEDDEGAPDETGKDNENKDKDDQNNGDESEDKPDEDKPDNDRPRPANEKGAFAGTFKGEGLVVQSRAQGDDYTGTFTLNGKKYPFTATAVNGVMHGAFDAGEEKFDFQAKRDGTKLILKTGDSTYTLQKEGASNNPLAKPANPLAKPGGGQKESTKTSNPLARNRGAAQKAAPRLASRPTVKPSPPENVAARNTAMPRGGPAGGTRWKTYRHATGLTVRYPANWTVKAGNGAVVLLPPDVTQQNGGPTELILIMATGAEGVTSGDDPRVEQAVEQQVRAQIPGLQREGETESIKAGTAPGILLRWRGESNGTPVRALTLATVLKQYAVGVLALGTGDKLQKREPIIRRIFNGLAAGAGVRDPKIVGAWRFWSYKGSTSGSYGRTTDRRMVLNADGSCTWGSTSEAGGNFSGSDQYGNETWRGGVASDSSSADRGTWSAANGELYAVWGDGSVSKWKYRLGGQPGNRRLFLQGMGSNKAPDEWVEMR